MAHKSTKDEMEAYAEQNLKGGALSKMTQALLIEKPKDPVRFMRQYLRDVDSKGHKLFSDRSKRPKKLVRSDSVYRNRHMSPLIPFTTRELFNEFDDATGAVSRDALCSGLKKCGLARAFLEGDKEGALAEDLAMRRQVNVWMKEFDKDQSGNLTYEEFAEVIRCTREKLAAATEVSSAAVTDSVSDAIRSCESVFLGGSCNPTTWRKDIAIPMLTRVHATFFNPQVDDWYPELLIEENRSKAGAHILFYVIDSRTRALASMIEAAELLAKGRYIVLVIKEIDEGTDVGGVKCVGNDLKDCNRARAYLADCADRFGAPVFGSIVDAVNHIIELLAGEGLAKKMKSLADEAAVTAWAESNSIHEGK
jgi:hypothetical protein